MYGAVPQILDPHLGDGLVGLFPVSFARLGKDVGRSAGKDHLPHGKRENRIVKLGEIADYFAPFGQG